MGSESIQQLPRVLTTMLIATESHLEYMTMSVDLFVILATIDL